jgi:hypothetical protein
VRNFTIFAPSDAAIQTAYESGAFDYPELFATKKNQLTGIVAYHAVPAAHAAPGPDTLNMETLMTQGQQGNASCANPSLSWRPDGFVYGGTGAAKVGGTYDRGCAAVIFTVDSMLQPCCKPMAELLKGMKAPAGSFTAKAIASLKARATVSGGRGERVGEELCLLVVVRLHGCCCRCCRAIMKYKTTP